MVTGPTGSSLSVWFSVRSFVRSFVRLFVRSCSGTQHLEFGICFSHKFESHQAQSVIYPFRSMRFVCNSARNAIDVLNLN
jgi:hypothetical protein